VSAGTSGRGDLARRVAELPLNKRRLLDSLLQQKRAALGVGPAIQRRNLTTAPLSFAQQRLWFLEQLKVGEAFYNVDSALRLQYALDHTTVEKVLNAIIRRHESLRTSFIAVDGQSVQVIAPDVQLKVPLVDLSYLSPSIREAEVIRQAADEARRPFDLSVPPLIRATLLQLGRADYVFLLTMHHMVSDGWSMTVLSDEFDKFYSAFSRGLASPLPELAVQYADYAVWQRQWLQGEILDEQLDYWRRRLRDLPVLGLRTDRPRAPIQSFRGAFCSCMIPMDITSSLRSLSQREGVTLFMTLLAAFQVLLLRYTGQEDIVVGVPSAGRTRPETQPLIGFFVNTLVMRSDLSGNPTFRELLHRVREVALGAYAHQEVPFERLVEEFGTERDLSRNPLFQVTFQLFSTTDGAGRVTGEGAQYLEVQTGHTPFDLAVGLIEAPEGLDTRFDYATDLFDTATVERMMRHFEILLRGAAENPGRRILDLPIMPEREMHRLLIEWNETAVKHPTEVRVNEMFQAMARRFPDRLALESDHRAWTYLEVESCSNRLAIQLRELGASEGALIGIFLQRGPEVAIAELAVWKSGGAFVPIDPSYPLERVRRILEDAGVALLITRNVLTSKLSQIGCPTVCVDLDTFDIDAGSGPADAPNAGLQASAIATLPIAVVPNKCKANQLPIEGESLAYMIYTSGSTGQPRGVPVEHRSLVNLICWHQRTYNVTPQDRAGQFASPSFDASIWELWPYLTAGACVCFPDECTRVAAPLLIAWLSRCSITMTFVPTPLLELMLAEKWPPQLELRALFTGGDRLRCTPDWSLGIPVYNHYGPTEATVVTTSTRVESSDHIGRLPPIGRPIDNFQVYVLDRELKPVPIGVPGELCISGIGLARGYWNQPDLTSQKFVQHPFLPHRDARLYRTGDLVRYRADGQLEFLDRIDLQVKLRGYRIEPGEIESVLRRHPAVEDAVVTAQDTGSGELKLIAYVSCVRGQHLNPGALRVFIQQDLPEYMTPSDFVFLDALPLTPNGKLDRKALQPPSSKRENTTNFVTPRTDLERVISDAWKSVLGLESVSVHDNFFDLGGHSLLMLKLHARLLQLLQVDISIIDLFRFPTVSSLARSLAETRPSYTAPTEL
jgi:amino acid adenylation domain-containing protein